MEGLWLPSSMRLIPPKRSSYFSIVPFYAELSFIRVSLLLKQLNGKLPMESMPLIQRLLQQDAASHGAGVQGGLADSNTVLPSPLSESAFVDILSAIEPLPDFDHRLAMVNEQGQTLLHLAIHLRYRTLVQKLVHWGIDINVKDVSGSTALHAAYLCDDLFTITLLERGDAEPSALDEVGRTSTELTAPTAIIDEDTTMDIDKIVPRTLDDVGRVDELRLPSDAPIPTQSQRTVIDSVDKAGEHIEYMPLSVIAIAPR